MTFQSQIPEEKRRRRFDAKPDPKLLGALKRGDPSAIQAALSMGNAAALAAVEEAIVTRSSNPNVEFYRVGGQVERNSVDPQVTFDKLKQMADEGRLLADTAYTQSLIAELGEEKNQVFLETMQENRQAAFDYQLLGIQMQLRGMMGSLEQAARLEDRAPSNTSNKTKTTRLIVGAALLILLVIGGVFLLIRGSKNDDLSGKARLYFLQINWDAWENLRYSQGFEEPIDPPADGSVYVLVEFSLKNMTSEDIIIHKIRDDNTVVLKDADGNQYKGEPVEYFGDGNNAFLVPGVGSILHYYFQVPEDVDIVEFVAYGMSADTGEKAVLPTPEPVSYSTTFQAENGISMVIHDATWGHDAAGNDVMITVDMENLGDERVYVNADESLYLIDDEGNYASIGESCSEGDREQQFYSDSGLVILNSGREESGQVCFYHLETGNRNYRLVYNPNDGFTPNSIFFLPAE